MDLQPLRDLAVDPILLGLLAEAAARTPLVVKPGSGAADWRVVAPALTGPGALYAGRTSLTLALDPSTAETLAELPGVRIVARNPRTWRARVSATALEDLHAWTLVLEATVAALVRATLPRTAQVPAEDPEAEGPEALVVPGLDVPAVLFNVARLWRAGMDEDALYDVVHGWWKLGPRRELADYAMAVAGGEIRGVYRVLGWRARREGDRDWKHDDPGKPRWGFDGEPAPELAHLIGLDVRALYPRGARTVVRYVNCGTQLPARVARLSSSPATVSSTLDELRDACDRLHANPVLHMSLHSKELFHSNTLGWLIEAHPDLAQSALEPWLVPDASKSELRVRREHRHLDLVVELPGFRALVIENKTFSLPDEQQLQRYDEHNVPEAGLADATRLLLSLPDPGWKRWGAWTWVSYGSLLERLRPLVEPVATRDGFAGELLDRYLDLVEDLLLVAELTRAHDDDEQVDLDVDQIAHLRRVRLADVMRKLRARQLLHRLASIYEAAGLHGIRSHVGMGFGGVLLESRVALPDGDALGWQLQSSQWRRFVVLSSLRGRGLAWRAKRADHAQDSYADWFDFTAEQRLHGPFQPGPTDSFGHFDPDFVHRYIKTPQLTVRELLDMGRAVATEACEPAAGRAEGESPARPS